MIIDPKSDQIRSMLIRLRAANKAYRDGTPIMSDGAYDALEVALKDELAGLSRSDEWIQAARDFLRAIGAETGSKTFAKVPHDVPMTSLSKANYLPEVKAWMDVVKGKSYVISDKMDGLSVDLKYNEGEFTRALTRGKDGAVGDDITRNVMRMKGFPQSGVKFGGTAFTGHIRAEIIVTHTDRLKHFPAEKNARNTAVGKAKSGDGSGSEHCTIVSYLITPARHRLKLTAFHALEAAGFTTPRFTAAQDLAEVEATYNEYIQQTRSQLDYDIDGLVVEIEDVQLFEELGEQDHRPLGAIAFKFPSEGEATQLLDLEWQVGNTGRLTPVALVEPIQLVGATISRVNMHNLDIIAMLVASSGGRPSIDGTGLRAGLKLFVTRRNDVIPYVEEILSGHGLSTPEFLVPTHCPACSHQTEMVGAYLVCPNSEECPAQVVGAISRWVKKIGVIGLGDAFIEAVVEHAGVNDAADMYRLKAEDLQDITVNGVRLGRKADLALEALHQVKELPLHVFVGSLGIPLCSRSVCKMIVDAGYDSLDKLERATIADIEAIPKMGSGRAESFVRGLFTKMGLIDRLLDVGVTIKPPAVGSLTGKSFCFSGFRDPLLEREIEAAGGSMKSSVGTGLTFLVLRDPTSVSGKAQKAQQLGVQLIGIDEAKKMVGV